MDKISRRSFFKAAGAALAATAAEAHALKTGAAQAQATRPPPYIFFKPDEANFIETAVERLIPADENGPGALAAGVPNYIDKQLGGAWGAGERLYRNGPWREGEVTQGYQLPFTPAELFRNALRGIRTDLGKRGVPALARLAAEEQDAYLKSLQTGTLDLNGVPSRVFFESLLALTVEGFFSDPVYGGNKDMAAWKMIGFPGAYASYYELVDQHGIAFTRAPMSMGQDNRGVIHMHRSMPPAQKPGAPKGGK
ncbi:gluconate 2-dehydrogenase subunit 3 family protein [Noviherbaspirillum cavernae]|uniref:Gluconate 2-dehydrogenase subunit 3 family protein n=1 Tax=Noviherbaspirillum cavernae TaxID=2320862 RepID=A0A418WX77_9BURK|nr:gluconate 2-dehydrogenase subunit 3 family protein [Noviherbaspirillum cavernae]RJG04695.1 gluconate 2-dehydrogenase subunit 3 family protein [Noviherbaspirillum cavernae]